MIFAPKMSEIILEFESFELEPDPTPPTGVFCRYDRLEIWDGFPGGEQAALVTAVVPLCAFFNSSNDQERNQCCEKKLELKSHYLEICYPVERKKID